MANPQAFAASAFAKDECVQSHDIAIRVHQGTAAVTTVDGIIGLDVDHRLVRIRLPPNRTDHPHGYRILQAFRTSNRQNQLSRMHRAVRLQGQCGKIVTLHLEQGQVRFLVQAHELCLQNFRFAQGLDLQGRYGRRGWQHHANPLCTFHNMGIGHNVAIRIDYDSEPMAR